QPCSRPAPPRAPCPRCEIPVPPSCASTSHAGSHACPAQTPPWVLLFLFLRLHALTGLVTLPCGRLPSTLLQRSFGIAPWRQARIFFLLRTRCLSASAAFRAWRQGS